MPQIDKVTFSTLVYWLFVIYLFMYLDLFFMSLFPLLSERKLRILRVAYILRRIQLRNLRHAIMQIALWARPRF
jgi:hypothetical protein